MRWQAEALCAQTDPELWFPEKGKHHPQALQICFRCPVRAQCAEAGQGEEYGIWGGLTRDNRRQKRRRERQPCGTPAAYKWHRRHGEDCQPCKEAEARRSRDRLASRTGVAS